MVGATDSQQEEREEKEEEEEEALMKTSCSSCIPECTYRTSTHSAPLVTC